MSDIFGNMNDLRKLKESLSWFKDWAYKQCDNRKDFDNKDFITYHERRFKDCPHFYLGFYALFTLREDIAKRETGSDKIKIYISRLAKLEL